jgi:hypothetical protein
MNKEIAKYLHKIGVDSRFVSILDDQIVVNNLRYSRFSRAREELFYHEFPEIRISRSKVFQRIATRASRSLKAVLKPKHKIALIRNKNCASLTQYAILEPYTRKYGIEIIKVGSWEELYHLDVDKVALPFELDYEVEALLEKMLNGDRISLESDRKSSDEYDLIYPLINIPRDWINSWADSECIPCTENVSRGIPAEMVQFLSSFIPDVREKMYRSALFLKENELKS